MTILNGASPYYVDKTPLQHHKGTGQQYKMYPPPVDDVMHDGTPYRPADKLKGRAAIVTGADSGIGRSISLLFALEGADLTLHHLPQEQEDMDDVVNLIKVRAPHCNVLTVASDLREIESCKDLVEKHMAHHGHLTTLILNHGTQEVQMDWTNISQEQWLNTFSVNIHPYFYITKAAINYIPRGGSITMNSSINTFKGNPSLIDYTATKGAMIGFARALSNAVVKEKGIRVNVVAPGPIWTPLIPATMPEEKQKTFGKNVPMDRPGQPVEVATCFVFLSSSDSSYMSGQVLHPNGGVVLS